jgi:winged helix-turn helix protein
MTTQDQLIRARLGILAMAAELKNVARACKLAGVSRSQFYAMKKAYETHGKEALAPLVRRKPDMPNRTAAPLVDKILLNTRTNPTISYLRLAGYMKSEGINVTPTMVRYVWERHGLSTRSARLRWVKRRNGQSGGERVEDGQNTLNGVHSAEYVTTDATPSPLPVTDVS